MKIGVSTLAFYPQTIEEVLDFLENWNIKYCEIINEYPHDELDEDVLGSYQMNLTVHAPLSDINLASHNQTIRKSSIAEVKKSFDRAVNWDAELVVVHPGNMPVMGRKISEKIFQYNLKSLTELSSYAEDCGICMCVENMPKIDGLLFQDLRDLNLLLEDINEYMTLDVGHAHNSGFSVSDMFCYPLIKHVHLSDNDGTWDQHDALGTGSIDFVELFNSLNNFKYDGVLVVEVKNTIEVIKSLEFINNII